MLKYNIALTYLCFLHIFYNPVEIDRNSLITMYVYNMVIQQIVKKNKKIK